MFNRLMGVFIVLSILVAGCGDDSDSDSTGDEVQVEQPTSEPTEQAPAGDDGAEPAPTAEPEPEPVEEEPEPAPTAEPEPEPEPVEEEPEPTPEPLTASFRGVTESEIRIGVATIDATMFGFDQGDLISKWRVAIDTVNAAGGVNGRMLVPFFETVEAIGSAEADAACVRFVEDEQVFAFVGFLREDNELCYTELNDTIAVNANDVSEEAISRSNGLLFGTEATTLGIQRNMIAAAADAGLLDGKSVHVSALATGEAFIDPLVEALEAGGATVSSVTVVTAVSDVPAAEAEHDVIVQRIIDEGADLVYSIQSPELMAAALLRAGVDLPMITSEDGGDEFLNFGVDPAVADLLVFAPTTLTSILESGDPLLAECVDNYNNAQITDEDGNVELVNVAMDPDQPDNFSLAARACQAVGLFVAIATAAGPNLTNDSFREAAASLGSIELPGMTAASIGEGKFDADDTPLIRMMWNADEQQFEPAG